MTRAFLPLFFLMCAGCRGDRVGCLHEGIFPDIHDPKQYTLCVRDQNRLKMGKMTCGPNTVYSPQSRRCRSPDSPPEISKLLTSFDDSYACRKPGFRCTGCNTLFFCLGITGGFPTIPVLNGTCRDGFVCDEKVGCVTDEYCPFREFECFDEGIFPDPYDCQLYHECSFQNGTMLHEAKSCEMFDSAFDPIGRMCGASLNSNSCSDRPVPKCIEHLQFGALEANPNIFYICLVDEPTRTIAPLMMSCPGGKIFVPEAVTCVDRFSVRRTDK